MINDDSKNIQIKLFNITYDARSISYRGLPLFRFSPTCALVVCRMIINHLDGHSTSVSELRDVINDAKFSDEDELSDGQYISKTTRIRDYFRNHAAWGTLIKSTGGPNAYWYLDFDYDPRFNPSSEEP